MVCQIFNWSGSTQLIGLSLLGKGLCILIWSCPGVNPIKLFGINFIKIDVIDAKIGFIELTPG